MRYYEVYVSQPAYQKREPLTYQSSDMLAPGTLVEVPYGKKSTVGFVVAQTSKPSFQCKTITNHIDGLHPLPSSLITLHEWLLEYYPYGAGSTTQAFIPSGLDKKIKDIELDAPPKLKLPKLTADQQEAVNQVSTSSERSFLLYGETGSGKTRLYIELAAQVIGEGKSAVFLVPEISLIPQLKSEIEAGLGKPVLEMHSDLTKSQKLKNWKHISQSAEPQLVVGTRSALFSPIKHLGLIVVDEMHEPAYKQDSAPRYNALRVAAQLSKINQCRIIYGSATPPVVEYFVGQSTKTPVLRLKKPAREQTSVKRKIIDIKDRSNFSKHPQISDKLIDAISNRLDQGQQSLLFLNRRGTARQILCQECGWQALCPKCDLPLTLHSDTHNVRCHTCGYSAPPPLNCPRCGSQEIQYRSIGTKSLANDLEKLFPTSNIKRFDTDNSLADSLAKNFAAVKSGEIDILVGTQMLGKGLDLPKLSLVGVVNADTSLHMPDFSSTERSYQLLHQAIGRVGRGHVEGEVLVQTYNPNDGVLQAAVAQDWRSLYDYELAERQKFVFPPFCYLLKISMSRKTALSAEDFAIKLHQHIKKLGLRLEIEEPVPSFYEKSHGKYNWQIIIKAKDRKLLLEVIASLPTGDFSYDIDPSNLL